MNRKTPVTFAQAINDGTRLMMDIDQNIVVIGQLADTQAGIFGTTRGLYEDFPGRVHDFPIAEGLMHAVGLGMSIYGAVPLICHQRFDFMVCGLDAIVNWLNLWYFKTGSKQSPHIVIRAIVGKGWGQAPQHSKNLISMFAGLPGLNIYCPSSPHDAKAGVIDALNNKAPALIVEHRSLFSMEQVIPDDLYVTERRPRQLKEGDELTIVCMGDTVPMVLKAAEGIEDLDIFDLRMIQPLVLDNIIVSVNRTHNLLIVEPGWKNYGIGAEIAAQVSSIWPPVAVRRIGYPDTYTPMSEGNEAAFYPSVEEIKEAIIYS